jgi:hypothetical protein
MRSRQGVPLHLVDLVTRHGLAWRQRIQLGHVVDGLGRPDRNGRFRHKLPDRRPGHMVWSRIYPGNRPAHLSVASFLRKDVPWCELAKPPCGRHPVQEYNPPLRRPLQWSSPCPRRFSDTLATRETMYVNCGHPLCCKSTKLDIPALIDRLGPDHGSMHDDLVGVFGCSSCKAAGRGRRPVYFTVIPDYDGMNAKRNREWKPPFGRG